MLTSPVHPLQIAGVGFTVALLALAWSSRGRLNSMGFEFLHWNRTSGRENAEALGFGAVCGLAVALLFQALYKGTHSNGRMPGSESRSVRSWRKPYFAGISSAWPSGGSGNESPAQVGS
jgi:hypothetical protein